MDDIRDLRKTLTAQYASWLRDIDDKCRLTVMIAAVLLGISAKQLLDAPRGLSASLLCATAFLSLLALIYGIRGYTARHTSGRRAGYPVKLKLEQWFSYLFNCPERWQYSEEDEIGTYKRLAAADPATQSNAHLQFFREKYGTEDPEVIANLRLFELRASNYHKLSCERVASKLLIGAIVLICVSVATTMVYHPSASVVSTSPSTEFQTISRHLRDIESLQNKLQQRLTQTDNSSKEQAAQVSALLASQLQIAGQLAEIQRSIERNKASAAPRTK